MGAPLNSIGRPFPRRDGGTACGAAAAIAADSGPLVRIRFNLEGEDAKMAIPAAAVGRPAAVVERVGI